MAFIYFFLAGKAGVFGVAKTKVAEKGAKEPISVPIQIQQVNEAAGSKDWEKVVALGSSAKSVKVAMCAAERLAENAQFGEFTEIFELRRIREAAGKGFWMVVAMTGVETKSDRVAMAAAEALIRADEFPAALYLGLSTPSDKARAYIDDELQKRKKRQESA